MNLKGAVIVITGASKGLGAELAGQLRAHGATVVGSSHSGAEGTILSDVRVEAQVRDLAAEVIKRHGHIDVWINNAGVRIPHSPVAALDMARVQDMFAVNVYGTMHGSREAVRAMQPRGRGAIINILSRAALAGRADMSAYCASKAAADKFTDSLRLEVADRGITVIGVYPGGIKTHFFDEDKPADYESYLEPSFVAKRIVDNLAAEKPETSIEIKRPTA